MGKVIVVGGGAAGMMAAYAAAKGAHQVVLLEKNEKLGKKVYITGKGRCNVTNAGETADFFAQVVRNPKSLYSAVYSYDAFQVIAFMEENGCKLKTERGNRVFPQSDHASDVIRACAAALEKAGVTVKLNTKAAGLLTEICAADAAREEADMSGASKGMQCAREEAGAGKSARAGSKAGEHAPLTEYRIRGVRLADGKKLEADAVVIATGGLSYKTTGSDGDGLCWAREYGMRIEECMPALVPLVVREAWCRDLQGLSLKNVKLTLAAGGKVIFSEQGEMLFTHFGISGPLVLSASSYYAEAMRGRQKAGGQKTGEEKEPGGRKADEEKTPEVTAYIDLKPALSEEQLDKRLIREFDEKRNKQFKNALDGLFPSKLIPVMVALSDIPADTPLHELTRAQRQSFAALIKKLPLSVTGTRGFEEAIVTQGGVSIREIDPSTMESKKVRGLYFAGEVLDVDALTGGYNLQIAWSTGHLAGASIPPAAKITEKRGKKMSFNVAIDGPAGAGKSTIAKRAAKEMGFIYVDTGAMYRAMALYLTREGVDPADDEAVREMSAKADITIRHEDGQQVVYLNGENVNGLIRTEEVGNMASQFSKHPDVRNMMTDIQKKLAANEDVIMNGRDIGTCVLPNADVKIYLTASSAVRAKRRYDELLAKGTECDIKTIEEDIIERDRQDMTREISPLRQADDAVLVDSSDMTIDEVVGTILSMCRKKKE